MRIRILGALALAAMVLSLAEAVKGADPEAEPEPNLEITPNDAEPVKCFKVAWRSENESGWGLPMGPAVALCGGTRSAKETLKCFSQAYSHPGNHGLGFSLGMAVELCRTNRAQE